MRKLIAIAALALASASAVRAQAAPPSSELLVDRIVAVVGTTPLTWNEVMERVNQMRQQGTTIPSDSVGQMAFARDILTSMIDDELLLQRAKAEKIDVADADVSPQVEAQLKKIQANYKTDQELKDELKKTGFGTKEEFRRYLADNIKRGLTIQKLMDKMRQDQKLTPVPVTEADVTAFFNEHAKEAEHLPATIAFRQIVIAPAASAAAKDAAKAKAEALLKEIKDGGDFEKIAKRESMDPSTKDLGGDLGWQRRGEFVPEFERWYFGLPPGQTSTVFETTFGYHIVKIDRVQPAEVKGRHILIIPKVDSAQVVAARRIADSVAVALRGGAKFEPLAKKYHDYDSKEQDIVPPFPRAQLPEAYQKAFAGKKVGDVTPPFGIEDKRRGVDKLVIAQITAIAEDRAPSAADYREQIKGQLAQQRMVRHFIDSIKKDTYVNILM
ncbi:MAG: peptidylprolyl isomerase [Gemmatimonadota bacterium]|nr:peptidylprolyl isomerase [Gemmatimonadota bacterium]